MFTECINRAQFFLISYNSTNISNVPGAQGRRKREIGEGAIRI